MDSAPDTAPVLSTPDNHIFEAAPQKFSSDWLSDEQLFLQYEIKRTVTEIKNGKWSRVALQFPDSLLPDAPRVCQALSKRLRQATKPQFDRLGDQDGKLSQTDNKAHPRLQDISPMSEDAYEPSVFILADTSFGACCVDEVAAEHAFADVVVHYGRSCLSPTARLPVIYVFTKPPLNLDAMERTFEQAFATQDHVILMADAPYQAYLDEFASTLQSKGYHNIFTTRLVHDDNSPLPNRTIPPAVLQDSTLLNQHSLFHVSEPPPALLLTVASQVKNVTIYHVAQSDEKDENARQDSLAPSTIMMLRRRYALLTKVASAPVIGILINTLSVRSYIPMLNHIKSVITSAGKKPYTLVVGKVNAAKVANFAEVGGWVVVGCWESSLFDSTDFWKPILTPWELQIALTPDQDRVWTGSWRSNFGAVLNTTMHAEDATIDDPASQHRLEKSEEQGMSDEEDSAPPEFDLRTGRYVSHSRPLARAIISNSSSADGPHSSSTEVLRRHNGGLATIGGLVSPAAEFLKANRSWQGLGSDYTVEYDHEGEVKPLPPAKVESGLTGVARGYVSSGGSPKH